MGKVGEGQTEPDKWNQPRVSLKDFFIPGVTAFQLILQPDLEPRLPVLKVMLMLLLLDTIAGGKDDPMSLPSKMVELFKEEPQLFPIKVVPSPSMIVKWSQLQLRSQSTGSKSMSKALNSNDKIIPRCTCISSVFSRKSG